MLIFISDLHLTDEGFKEAIPIARLAAVIDGFIQRAVRKGIDDIQLVLLGDIFEIVKSQQWIETNLRPWESSTPAHQQVVSTIFESILKANADFAGWLGGLPARQPPVRLKYIPGNHDLAINTEMGAPVRRRLRSLLSQPGSSDAFDEEIRDSRHSVVAVHGHQWDSFNRSGSRGEPFGDVNVIEVLVRLPLRMAEKLQMNLRGTALDFLFEVDNVRPQTQGGMARWLELGLNQAYATNRDIEPAFDDVCNEILETLWTLGRTGRFEVYRYSSWRQRAVAHGLTRILRVRGLHRLMHLLPLTDDARGHYPDFIRGLLRSGDGDPPKYAICGHTHIPEHVPISPAQGRHSLYLNTGTWRRVHVPRNLDRPSEARSFASHQAECVAVIFDADEQRRGLPPYEFYRTVHGLR